MTSPTNLLGGPPPTHLPAAPAVDAALAGGGDPREVAAAHPSASLPWALLAERALDAGEAVTAYAYARTGYHRGLDALRRAGWRGHGPVPWAHEPNRGFLRALAALQRAATAIGEEEESTRCRQFLGDCDPAAVGQLLPDAAR
ncbi:DUF3151 domain-containing protein [Kineococcus terrestris]|uniref:DUF3151 domain-containing protein n=1 Tax=Kineococcus terrestris TaxID=2044856 RepID=UPI0034DB6312